MSESNHLSDQARRLLERERETPRTPVPPVIPCPKLGYIDADAAEAALDRLFDTEYADDAWMMVYRCGRCHRWHCGHAPARLTQSL